MERQDRVQRDLNAEFAAEGERGFTTPIANIASVAALLASSRDPAAQQALRMAQWAWWQLNRQNPAPLVLDAQQEGAG